MECVYCLRNGDRFCISYSAEGQSYFCCPKDSLDPNCVPQDGKLLKCSSEKEEAASEKYELCEHEREGCALDEINARTY